MQIGDLASATGLSRDALRFYEQRGLIASERSGATAATRGRCCGESRSSSSPSGWG